MFFFAGMDNIKGHTEGNWERCYHLDEDNKEVDILYTLAAQFVANIVTQFFKLYRTIYAKYLARIFGQ